MQHEIQQGSLLTSVFIFKKKISSTNKFMGIPGLVAVHVKKQLGFLLTTDSLWGINGMWLIKTEVRAVLDHSHKSSVPIRGWQLNPVLVGSHWSSVCTSRHPFHCWNMAPLTRFCKGMFSYTPSPKAVCWHGTNELTLLLQSSNVMWTRSLAQISAVPALCGLSLLLWFPLARDSSLSWGWWNNQKSDWQPLQTPNDSSLLPQSQHNPLSLNQAVRPRFLFLIQRLQETSLATFL